MGSASVLVLVWAVWCTRKAWRLHERGSVAYKAAPFQDVGLYHWAMSFFYGKFDLCFGQDIKGREGYLYRKHSCCLCLLVKNRSERLALVANLCDDQKKPRVDWRYEKPCARNTVMNQLPLKSLCFRPIELWKRWMNLGFGLTLAIALDQVLKFYVRRSIAVGEVWDLGSYMRIVRAWNPGISFGLFACETWIARMILLVISLFFISLLLYWYGRAQRSVQLWALGLILGGALGNAVDRIYFGAVFDFISLHVGSWAFPAFNVADMLVSIGFLTLMWDNFQWKASDVSKLAS